MSIVTRCSYRTIRLRRFRTIRGELEARVILLLQVPGYLVVRPGWLGQGLLVAE